MDDVVALIAATQKDQLFSHCETELFLLYSDLVGLESHKVALTFQLTTGDDKCNRFKNMGRKDCQMLHQSIINMVLTTKMTRHLECVNKFINSVNKPLSMLKENDETDKDQESINTMLTFPKYYALIKQMLTCQPLQQCIIWDPCTMEEHFSQTNGEKWKELSVVLLVFNRKTRSIPKSQISFIDSFIIGMFDPWETLVDLPK
ncbi:LOW QUALITY PROTEIN: high affinity cAMP-specific and IBMX-insensitive 3',5'-cyclic phosphodiesterase 8A-like [Ctenodactylus gundi]